MISREILAKHQRALDALAGSPHAPQLRDAIGECMADLLKDLASSDLANVTEAARLQGAIQTLDTLAEYLVPSR